MQRIPGNENHHFIYNISDETKQLIHSKSLSNEKAVLVCSEKLTNENWNDVELDELLTVEPSLEIRKIKL